MATVSVGSAATGTVADVYLHQGDHVVKGQLLSQIDCDDLSQRIKQQQAEQTEARAVLDRLQHGSRPDEIALQLRVPFWAGREQLEVFPDRIQLPP
jgi:multidrug efflux pump subunit AcrA (membrane-fusion protein)